MKKSLKTFFSFGFIILFLFMFVGCRESIYYKELENFYDNKIYLNKLHIVINDLRFKSYQNNELKAEDFMYENILSIEYSYSPIEALERKGTVYVSLKTNSLKEYRKAIKHFRSLPFIDDVLEVKKGKAYI